MDDYSYLGSGNIYLREYGAAAPLVEVGNCSALSFSPQEEVKELKDYTNPGGGTRNEVRRLTGVEVTYTFHDFSPDNFARALRGAATPVSAGTATAEEVVAYKGGFTPLAYIPTAITKVVDAETGLVEYEAGTDFEFRDGGIYIPSGSTFDAPEDGAPNIKVTYSYAKQTKVQALINSNKQYELVFVGLNEARSGKQVRVVAHKVSAGLLQAMALLGEDYGAGEVGGKLLSDPTKTGEGISKYFTVETVD
jgi:hypothetical protein